MNFQNITQPGVSIIILNWNGWTDTIECLESLYRSNYTNYEVILIDNNSTDESLGKIREWTEKKIEVCSKYFEKTYCTHDIDYREISIGELNNGNIAEKDSSVMSRGLKPLLVIKNDKNSGFAGGCNIGMRHVIKKNTSDYVFLLNNDTTLEENYLSEVFETLKNNNLTHIGCFGGKIFNYYTDDYWIRYYSKYASIEKVSHLTGAGLFISVESLKEKGLLDEYLFLYCEDYDLTYRISYSYNNYYLDTKSKMYHKEEASTKKIFEKKLTLQIRNQFILYKRHNQYYSFFSFVRTLLIFLNNNRKVNFYIAFKAFLIGFIKGIVELINNKGPIY